MGPAARARRAVHLPDDAALPVVDQGAPARLVRHRRLGVGRADPHPDPAARRSGRTAVRVPLRPGLLPVPVPADRPRSWRPHLVRGLDRHRHRLPREPVGHGRDLLRLVRVTTTATDQHVETSASTAVDRRSWALPLIALFIGGFAIRWLLAVVLLPDGGHHSDIEILTDWTHELAANGPAAFYRAEFRLLRRLPAGLSLHPVADRPRRTCLERGIRRRGRDPVHAQAAARCSRTSGSPPSRCS